MTPLRFRIYFHSPFHLFLGMGAKGVDNIVDSDEPVSASALKGVMRHQGEHVLKIDPSVIAEVFGGWQDDPARQIGARGCPWHFVTPRFDSPTIRERHRIAIDESSGTVEDGAMLLHHEVWAESAEFDIEQRAYIDNPARHIAVIKACAQCMTSIGASRNRGYGWVTVRIVDGDCSDLTDEELEILKEIVPRVKTGDA